MLVYCSHLKPNEIAKGCLSSKYDYPFNVHEFINQISKEEFILIGINKVKSSCYVKIC